MFVAAPPRADPAMKTRPEKIMEGLRPKDLVTEEAKKEATRPAKYKEDVKDVRSWLSNLQ